MIVHRSVHGRRAPLSSTPACALFPFPWPGSRSSREAMRTPWRGAVPCCRLCASARQLQTTFQPKGAPGCPAAWRACCASCRSCASCSSGARTGRAASLVQTLGGALLAPDRGWLAALLARPSTLPVPLQLPLSFHLSLPPALAQRGRVARRLCGLHLRPGAAHLASPVQVCWAGRRLGTWAAAPERAWSLADAALANRLNLPLCLQCGAAAARPGGPLCAAQPGRAGLAQDKEQRGRPSAARSRVCAAPQGLPNRRPADPGVAVQGSLVQPSPSD